MELSDLTALGHVALYRAAHHHDVNINPEFRTYAFFYVRGAMLNAVDDLLFEERIKRAAAMTMDRFCAFHNGDDYDVMKHDAAEARRRYRAFANGVLAATFAAATEEAEQCLDPSDL